MEFGKPAKDEGVGPVKGEKARRALFGACARNTKRARKRSPPTPRTASFQSSPCIA